MKFTGISTPRLKIRSFAAEDTAALIERRNDPRVARYQNWTLPYSSERAESLVASLLEMDGPTNDEWWMATVTDGRSDQILGDLAVGMTWSNRCAEIGYTLASEHWGEGVATEAAEALIHYLFNTVGVTRVMGTLHPENLASAMVLERTGLVFEGHTRNSYWVGDDNSDDWIYGMTLEDHDAWTRRPRHQPSAVTLVPIDHANSRDVAKLQTHWTQRRLVAPVDASFRNALFPDVVDGAPVTPWLRAVEADGDLAGFVMLALATDVHPEPYLWRLLVDRMHQRRGLGTRILDLVVTICKEMGANTLVTSWNPDRGTPEGFYRRYGFEPTGEVVDGEVEARLTFV